MNKWCKSLSPISWGVVYSLKIHTKGINQFLYGVQPDLQKIKHVIYIFQHQPKYHFYLLKHVYIHGEEHEIILPPGILLHYTNIRNDTDMTILGATAFLLSKYWIGINGLIETKPTNDPYIMIDWEKGYINDTLPEHKLFDDFSNCVGNVFPSECKFFKSRSVG